MTPSILNSFVLGYAPLTDAARQACGWSLSLTRVDTSAIDARHLLAVLDDIWPDDARLILDIRDPDLLIDTLQQAPRPYLQLKVPAELARHAVTLPLLTSASSNGHHLLCAGDLSTLAGAHPQPFAGRWLYLDPGRLPPHGVRPEDLCSGATSRPIMQACFDAGAAALVGWPVRDTLASLQGTIATDTDSLQRVIELVQGEASLDLIEQAILHEPILAWRLLRHLNDADSGLPIQVNSLRRGLMMLGYGVLERWLTEQQDTRVPSPDLRPVMRATVLRAQFMEHLVLAGEEDELSREIYFCGLFSALDDMLGRPMPELLDGLPLSARVPQALIERIGPYSPFLELVLASERPDSTPVLEIARAHEMDIGLVNRALLRTLATAAQWKY
jgi:HD-like signal output (HDOD) protein